MADQADGLLSSWLRRKRIVQVLTPIPWTMVLCRPKQHVIYKSEDHCEIRK